GPRTRRRAATVWPELPVGTGLWEAAAAPEGWRTAPPGHRAWPRRERPVNNVTLGRQPGEASLPDWLETEPAGWAMAGGARDLRGSRRRRTGGAAQGSAPLDRRGPRSVGLPRPGGELAIERPMSWVVK